MRVSLLELTSFRIPWVSCCPLPPSDADRAEPICSTRPHRGNQAPNSDEPELNGSDYPVCFFPEIVGIRTTNPVFRTFPANAQLAKRIVDGFSAHQSARDPNGHTYFGRGRNVAILLCKRESLIALVAARHFLERQEIVVIIS